MFRVANTTSEDIDFVIQNSLEWVGSSQNYSIQSYREATFTYAIYVEEDVTEGTYPVTIELINPDNGILATLEYDIIVEIPEEDPAPTTPTPPGGEDEPQETDTPLALQLDGPVAGATYMEGTEAEMAFTVYANIFKDDVPIVVQSPGNGITVTYSQTMDVCPSTSSFIVKMSIP